MLFLTFLGLFVGAFGTMIGTGGGFILMPIFLLLYPGESPTRLTALSLAVVCLNAISGTWAYHRKQAVHFPSGLVFGAAAIPGSLLGTFVVARVSSADFQSIFGVFMVIAAVYLFRKTFDGIKRPHVFDPAQVRAFRPNLQKGSALGSLVGFASSTLGIGGGIILVPAMVHALKYPVMLAAGTSQLFLISSSLVACLSNFFRGSLDGQLDKVIPLGFGAIVGAQAGAHLARRVSSNWLLRLLAIAVAAAGLRLSFF
ncbi:MAG: sulfite exporter TauE/SafE family protein [Bacteriovoracia bacterium]